MWMNVSYRFDLDRCLDAVLDRSPGSTSSSERIFRSRFSFAVSSFSSPNGNTPPAARKEPTRFLGLSKRNNLVLIYIIYINAFRSLLSEKMPFHLNFNSSDAENDSPTPFVPLSDCSAAALQVTFLQDDQSSTYLDRLVDQQRLRT